MNRICSPKRTVVGGLICMTLMSLTARQAYAEVVIDWGGNYTESPAAFGNSPIDDFITTHGSGANRTSSVLNDGPRNLTPLSGYNALDGKTSAFWGGWMAGTPNVDAPNAIPGYSGGEDAPIASWDNNRSVWANRITISVKEYQARLRGMIYFSKDGFLNGTDGGGVAFDESSSLSFSGITDGNFGPDVRWIVQDGGVWYISETYGSGTYNTRFTMALENPNAAQWAVFEPYSDGTYNAAPESGYAPHTFSNVQAAGIYFDSYGLPSRGYDGDGWSRFALEGFMMEATAVPEPSVVSLIGTALIASAWSVYARKRQQTSRVD